jgi:hypothetical protein
MANKRSGISAFGKRIRRYAVQSGLRCSPFVAFGSPIFAYA